MQTGARMTESDLTDGNKSIIEHLCYGENFLWLWVDPNIIPHLFHEFIFSFHGGFLSLEQP